MESNKGEDELSSPGRHIHLSQLVEQFHQERALSHIPMTAYKEKNGGKNQLISTTYADIITIKQQTNSEK